MRQIILVWYWDSQPDGTCVERSAVLGGDAIIDFFIEHGSEIESVVKPDWTEGVIVE